MIMVMMIIVMVMTIYMLEMLRVMLRCVVTISSLRFPKRVL